jgi:hypothetical protein
LRDPNRRWSARRKELKEGTCASAAQFGPRRSVRRSHGPLGIGCLPEAPHLLIFRFCGSPSDPSRASRAALFLGRRISVRLASSRQQVFPPGLAALESLPAATSGSAAPTGASPSISFSDFSRNERSAAAIQVSSQSVSRATEPVEEL